MPSHCALPQKPVRPVEALQLIEPVEVEIRSIVGEYIFGTDEDTLSSKAAELLIRNGWTLAAAESLTAGLFMAELANEPGISASLEGGMIVYNEKAKLEQLGLEPELLEEYGVVSANVRRLSRNMSNRSLVRISGSVSLVQPVRST